MSWMVCNRLDLAHAISVVSRFIADLGTCSWGGRYMIRTISYGPLYRYSTHNKEVIERFVDVDYVGNVDISKLIFGYFFTTIWYCSLLESQFTTSGSFIYYPG